ncbi:hypothetical protein NC651_033593 [Populus alba x Populus x berolinensis]|nr:hypothetical protein NC651_033593 [Populus alba x Populus x berolinensis]
MAPKRVLLVKTSTLYPVVQPTIPKLCPASSLVNTVIVKACSEDETLEDALLEEDQLDFSFSDDDCCDGSPLPSPLAAPVLPLATLREDIPPQFEVWNLCVVGYISGKSPGYRALNGIITSVLKCEALLIIHDSGWLIYQFKREEDKLVVLHNGPYLVYGKPLILKQMTTYFYFSNEEMMRAPIWCDHMTSNLSHLSYARVLVELDLHEDTQHSIEVSLPSGSVFQQKVVYESLPKFCNFCNALDILDSSAPKLHPVSHKEQLNWPLLLLWIPSNPPMDKTVTSKIDESRVVVTPACTEVVPAVYTDDTPLVCVISDLTVASSSFRTPNLEKGILAFRPSGLPLLGNLVSTTENCNSKKTITGSRRGSPSPASL